MSDRRYSDEEARHILALAAEVEAAAPAGPADGWTLAELQRAAAEAGLAPASISAAALTLDRAASGDARYLGVPVAVSRAVPLARAMSDDEWERLVGRLRDTFGTTGHVQVTGSGRREWRVGHLRVTYEAAGDGGVLALRTLKGNARALPTIGLLFLATAGVLGITGAATAAGPAWGPILLAAGSGVGFLIGGIVSLPLWARERARQFEALGTFARRLTG